MCTTYMTLSGHVLPCAGLGGYRSRTEPIKELGSLVRCSIQLVAIWSFSYLVNAAGAQSNLIDNIALGCPTLSAAKGGDFNSFGVPHPEAAKGGDFNSLGVPHPERSEGWEFCRSPSSPRATPRRPAFISTPKTHVRSKRLPHNGCFRPSMLSRDHPRHRRSPGRRLSQARCFPSSHRDAKHARR